MDLGLDENIFQATREIQFKYELYLDRLFTTRVIEKQIPEISDSMLRDFYLKQKNTLYYQKAKSVLHVVLADNPDEAAECWKKLQRSDSFKRTDYRVQFFPFIKTKEDVVEPVRKNTPKGLEKFAFTMNLSEKKGPVQVTDPNDTVKYALIECVEKRPARQLSFEETLVTSLEKDLTTTLKKEIEQDMLDRLRRKYPVRLYPEVIRECLAEQSAIQTMRMTGN